MDFSQLKAKIDAGWQDLDHQAELTPEAAARLLAERARAYAAAVATHDALHVLERSAVVFRIGDERLAIPAEAVEAVVPLTRTDPLPLAPRFVHGVLAFRGQPVLVLALHSLAGRPVPTGGEAQLVVTRWRQGLVALLVDGVEGIRSLAATDVLPPGDHTWLESVGLAGVLPDGVVLLHVEGLARQLESSTSDANKWSGT